MTEEEDNNGNNESREKDKIEKDKQNSNLVSKGYDGASGKIHPKKKFL